MNSLNDSSLWFCLLFCLATGPRSLGAIQKRLDCTLRLPLLFWYFLGYKASQLGSLEKSKSEQNKYTSSGYRAPTKASKTISDLSASCSYKWDNCTLVYSGYRTSQPGSHCHRAIVLAIFIYWCTCASFPPFVEGFARVSSFFTNFARSRRQNALPRSTNLGSTSTQTQKG